MDFITILKDDSLFLAELLNLPPNKELCRVALQLPC